MTALLKEKAHYLLAVSWNKGTLLLECRVIFFLKKRVEFMPNIVHNKQLYVPAVQSKS